MLSQKQQVVLFSCQNLWNVLKELDHCISHIVLCYQVLNGCKAYLLNKEELIPHQ